MNETEKSSFLIIKDEIKSIKKLFKQYAKIGLEDSRNELLKQIVGALKSLKATYSFRDLAQNKSETKKIYSAIDNLVSNGSKVFRHGNFEITAFKEIDILFLLSNLLFKIFWEDRFNILTKEIDKEHKSDIDICIKQYYEKKVEILFRFRQTYIKRVNDVIFLLDYIIDFCEYEFKRGLTRSNYTYIYHIFEILGDIYINLAGILIEVPEDKIPNGAIFKFSDSIRIAFNCYEKAQENLKIIEIPGEIIRKSRIFPYLDVFYNFFGSRVDITSVQEKMDFIIVKYPQYFNKKIKSSCWKSTDFCEHRKNLYFDINEGNGVFVSMNYNLEENFELFKAIKKILSFYNLNAFLKQERLRSLSWSKEICCSIFNNKFAIVLLDKYSPNVVLELGVIFGMGRKAIILVNKNQKITGGSSEELLFSMIRDYECIFYSSFNDLFEKLINAINGIFFNSLDFKYKKVEEIFKKEEIIELKKVIQSPYE